MYQVIQLDEKTQEIIKIAKTCKKIETAFKFAKNCNEALITKCFGYVYKVEKVN